MKSVFKKLIAIGSIIFLLAAGYVVDSLIVKAYKIEFTEVKRTGDDSVLDADGNMVPYNCGVTDGETKIGLTIRLTRNDKPVKGHVLYVITNRSPIGRFRTEDDGTIKIDYQCYKTNSANLLKDIVVSVKDENNSIFVSVPCKNSYTIKMYLAYSSESSLTTTDFFE